MLVLVECVSDNLFGFNFQPRFHDKLIFTVSKDDRNGSENVIQKVRNPRCSSLLFQLF